MELPDIPFNKAEYIETVSKMRTNNYIIEQKKSIKSFCLKRPLEIELVAIQFFVDLKTLCLMGKTLFSLRLLSVETWPMYV